MENKKKAASQELEKHLEQVGLDMHRLELVEDLAIILKHGGVTDPELGKYIERQKQAAGGGLAAAVITIIVYALEVLGG